MTSTTSQATYPVRLTGELDPNLSRWLWLVKMFLAIPHYVLSRGLVPVKLLLAIPHLIIVGLIAGVILPYWWTDIDWSSGFQPIGGYSMLNLLVVLAGFFLLITRQYPRALFDLLVGINRWLYRVLVYVAFMRDEYPPFRLDMGQYEPGDVEPDGRATTPGFGRTPA
jgi:uncharacterized protein DUF4389